MKQSLVKYVAPGLAWLMALPALAQLPTGQRTPITPRQNLQIENILNIITLVANVMLAIIGVIAVIMILWGAGLYVTAGGNDEKVKEGKNFIIYGLIGIAIAVLAFAIVAFVNNFLSRAGV